MLEQLSQNDFLPLVGAEAAFRLYPGPWEQPYDPTLHPPPLDLHLIQTRALGVRHLDNTAQREPFALVFRQAAGVLLPQRIYAVEHAALGILSIFLVPIGPDASGMRYEAIFN
jgi:hypothetical protein